MTDASWLAPLALVIIAAAVFLRARRKHRPSAGAVNGWKINWSTGLPQAPTPQGAGWVIDVQPGQSLHYVQKYDPPSLHEGMMLTARLRVTGSFAGLEEPAPCVSLIIQRKGDSGREKGYRLYSFKSVPLTEGEHVLTVPVTPTEFGDVLETIDHAAFLRVLSEAESIGLLFGSDSGRGHGVAGVGRVELLSLA